MLLLQLAIDSSMLTCQSGAINRVIKHLIITMLTVVQKIENCLCLLQSQSDTSLAQYFLGYSSVIGSVIEAYPPKNAGVRGDYVG